MSKTKTADTKPIKVESKKGEENTFVRAV